MKNQIKKYGAGILMVSATMFFAFSAQAGDVDNGKAVYEGTCIFCHGENGKGEIPGTPDFTKASGPLSQDDATLIAHITDGFESPGSAMPMPAKGGNEELSDEDVADVLAYLRKAFGS
jgi:mono/diheme cytochrome c family protein